MALTREQVLNASDSDLDVMIAVHVMRQPVHPLIGALLIRGQGKSYYLIPKYSSDVSEAWEVLKNMKRYTFDLYWSDAREEGEQWVCIFSNGFTHYKVYGASAPKATCKATLLAVLDL